MTIGINNILTASANAGNANSGLTGGLAAGLFAKSNIDGMPSMDFLSVMMTEGNPVLSVDAPTLVSTITPAADKTTSDNATKGQTSVLNALLRNNQTITGTDAETPVTEAPVKTTSKQNTNTDLTLNQTVTVDVVTDGELNIEFDETNPEAGILPSLNAIEKNPIINGTAGLPETSKAVQAISKKTPFATIMQNNTGINGGDADVENTLLLNAHANADTIDGEFSNIIKGAKKQTASSTLGTNIAQSSVTPTINTPVNTNAANNTNVNLVGMVNATSSESGFEFSDDSFTDGETADGQLASELNTQQTLKQSKPVAHSFASHLSHGKGPNYAHPAVDQVSLQLQKSIEGKVDRISLQLDPADLGRVDIEIDFSGEKAKALIVADKQETLELLKQDSKSLEQIMEEMGLETDQDSLEFDLRQGENSAEFEDRSNKGGSSNISDDFTNMADGNDDVIEASIAVSSSGSIRSHQVNILV